MDKKIWLTGIGVKYRVNNKYKESLFNITLENIHIQLSNPIQNQIHLILGREELILLKKEIDKELKNDEM